MFSTPRRQGAKTQRFPFFVGRDDFHVVPDFILGRGGTRPSRLSLRLCAFAFNSEDVAPDGAKLCSGFVSTKMSRLWRFKGKNLLCPLRSVAAIRFGA